MKMNFFPRKVNVHSHIYTLYTLRTPRNERYSNLVPVKITRLKNPRTQTHTEKSTYKCFHSVNKIAFFQLRSVWILDSSLQRKEDLQIACVILFYYF